MTALAAIRTTQKLPCAVTFDPTGLQLRFLDGGHAMQSGISLSASVSAAGTPPASAGVCSAAAAAAPACSARPPLLPLLSPRCRPCLPAQVFSHFQSPASLSFYVPLSVLLDSVNSVASSAPQELQLQYPGPGNSLLLT